MTAGQGARAGVAVAAAAGGVHLGQEIGDAKFMSRSYVSRILRLALLAPDIVEAIVAGGVDQSLMLEQLDRPLPADWEEQWQAIPLVNRRRE